MMKCSQIIAEQQPVHAGLVSRYECLSQSETPGHDLLGGPQAHKLLNRNPGENSSHEYTQGMLLLVAWIHSPRMAT